MIHPLQNLHPVLQALLATSFTWLMTAFGAALVFFARDVSRKVLDGMLGFCRWRDDRRKLLVAPRTRYRALGRQRYACMDSCCDWFPLR